MSKLLNLLVLAVGTFLVQCNAFQILLPYQNNYRRAVSVLRTAGSLSDDDDDDNGDETGVHMDSDSMSASPSSSDSKDEEIFATSTIRIDDGGSDLTNRFKYKVNALMGVFDPANPDSDNDRSTGNILNAMLKFPVNYAFNVVGKTKGREDLKEQFIQQVKDIVQKGSGDDEENILCQVTPRGKSFTKVTVQAQVDSAVIISSIYEELGQLESSVMQF